jgi:hypothetical protein
MSVEELIEAVRRWKPSGALGVDPEALSRQIANVVSGKPGPFASHAHRFTALEAIYLRGILEGFTSALVAGKEVAWEPVVELCAWAAVHRPRARMAALRLLSRGMTQDKLLISTELAPRVWAAILPALDDPDPSAEVDRRRLLHDEPYNVAINTVRGCALEAVVDFAAWTAQGAVGRGLSREVREALEAKLADPAAAVRAVYGARFHVLAALDEPWSAELSPRIFRTEVGVGDPAWRAYLRYAARRAEAYRVLRWRYREALPGLGGDPDGDRIAADVARLFWHGWIDLGDRDADLELFFEHAPPSVGGELLEVLGRALSEKISPSAETLERLKRLWSRRARFGRSEELAAFGWWFSSARFDAAWSLGELETVLHANVIPAVPDRVARRLAALAHEHAAHVIACAALFWQNSEQSWASRYLLARAPSMLESAIASGDDRARRAAGELANRFLKAGHEASRPYAEV